MAAKFNLFMAMLAILLVVSSGQLDEELAEEATAPYGAEYWISPSPNSKNHLSPEEEYFEACVSVLGDNGCGDLIFNAIFKNETVVDPLCCTRFIQIGDGCGELMIEAALQFPDYNDVDPKKAYDRSVEVYEKCVDLVGTGFSPVPSA